MRPFLALIALVVSTNVIPDAAAARSLRVRYTPKPTSPVKEPTYLEVAHSFKTGKLGVRVHHEAMFRELPREVVQGDHLKIQATSSGEIEIVVHEFNLIFGLSKRVPEHPFYCREVLIGPAGTQLTNSLLVPELKLNQSRRGTLLFQNEFTSVWEFRARGERPLVTMIALKPITSVRTITLPDGASVEVATDNQLHSPQLDQ